MKRNYVGEFCAICDRMADLYEKKNKGYGNSYSEAYPDTGVIGLISPISHTYHRLINLIRNPKIDDLGEPIQDTLIDMANYCIMALMEIETHESAKVEEAQRKELEDEEDNVEMED